MELIKIPKSEGSKQQNANDIGSDGEMRADGAIFLYLVKD
jgi:hypothetical protein